MKPPSHPKIYHITHIENLPSIINAGFLFSDEYRTVNGLKNVNIGMKNLKARRLQKVEVACHSGTTLGQYVPFYFCPRSVMLYVIYMSDHPELEYRGGQKLILHLQIDMRRAIQWAESSDVLWAFSDGHAATKYAAFYSNTQLLNQVDWNAVAARDWREPQIRHRKQAEFLVYERIPWGLVEKIGVIDTWRKKEVGTILTKAAHVPEIAIERDWYY